MGLDTTHDCWSGAYSAFNRFRTGILRAAQGDYLERNGLSSKGFTIGYHWYPWDMFTENNLMGQWDTLPEDPLVVLIAHSDCEGIIPAAATGPLADRLEGLLPALDDDGVGGHYHGRKDVEQFIAGLRTAAAANEDVEFA